MNKTNKPNNWEEKLDKYDKDIHKIVSLAGVGLAYETFKEISDYFQQTLQSEKEEWRKEIIEIIGKYYIPGHHVVNPILDSIIKQLN